ncbi:MAG: hypothetical protein FGM61_04160 [Sediminibacterium sp.]|nr:hypothetical protein [Sediminibacterium sp.]
MHILPQLIRDLLSIGFWTRLFQWKSYRQKMAEALAELQLMQDRNDRLQSELTTTQTNLQVAQTEHKNSRNALQNYEIEKAGVDAELQRLRAEHNRLLTENNLMNAAEEGRIRERDLALERLAQVQEKIETDQENFTRSQQEKETRRLEEMKATWSRHQTATRERMKSICQKHTIEYVDKVPFKGDPDNTVTICDEYIVFDAKSPAGDDLQNFPVYLKGQAEKAVKYSKQEGVKKDIYFVVPSNTLAHLTQFVYPHADHDVYIIAQDALEPILLNLQKIEAYEFAEELTPDDRANICRVIGRFAHLAKRRIQVDHFFATQTIELAYACENALPDDIMEQVKEFERAEKLNPPQEKRTKAIPLAEIEKDNEKVQREAEGRGVVIDPLQVKENLNGMPLHKEQ